MSEKQINRLKAVLLSEQSKTNTWLAEKPFENRTFFLSWNNIKTQHLIEAFVTIARHLHFDAREHINTTQI